jgi:hypothetical protein
MLLEGGTGVETMPDGAMRAPVQTYGRHELRRSGVRTGAGGRKLVHVG